MYQHQLPEAYFEASEEELARRIQQAKAELGQRVVVLGHHYQRDEIIRWADFTGDSYKLSKLANSRPEAEFIVFCGVHFMAETADILSDPPRAVILPDLSAGCSMADMAEIQQVEDAWTLLTARYGPEIVPITYINSAASLKAFVGQHGGLVCTSSNAASALAWALERGKRVLFFPDQHLGRNTGVKLGIPLTKMANYNQYRGELLGDDAALADPTLILWQGHCSVHQKFTPAQVERVRAEMPGVKVIVHPECSHDVVRLADIAGSTELISKTIAEAPAGSQWAVGTEINLVSRLARQYTDKTVVSLSGANVCPCSTMYRISPQHLCWVLENLVAGQVVNQVRVDNETRHWAKVALDRMLSVPANV